MTSLTASRPPLAAEESSEQGSAAGVKVRVGFVMHIMQVAGAEVLVKQIIERLSDRIEPTIFCLDGVGELGEQLRGRGVPVIVLDRQPGLDRRVAKRLAHEVRERQIDVLHAHQYTPFVYSALARLLHGAKAKILFTEHGRHYPDVISSKRRWANRLALRRLADVSTGCCEFSTEALRNVEGFRDAITLHNGVDLSQLPGRGTPEEQRALRGELGLDPDRPYAACVARFHSVKDHPTLIRGWQLVHQALPDAKLLLVGDGEQRGSIQQLIESLDEPPRSGSREDFRNSPQDSELSASSATANGSFADSIAFWGIRHDVPRILRAIDVFTLTSISEAASLTLLEAMASECPAVLTDVGGNGEHVRDGEEGYLVPRGDHRQVGAKLIELLSHRDEARRMGQAARRRVIENFNLEGAIEAYARHYERLATP